jgi:hypothetical protein
MAEQAAAGAAKQVGGWIQPEHHQCRHLHESGQRCRSTTRTGEKFCHRHQRFADTDPMYPVKVPLLEDPDSIRLVMTQTVRALAVGTLPAANGRSMLYGCRMALDLLLYGLAREKFRAREQREAAAAAAAMAPKPPAEVGALQPVMMEECAAESEAVVAQDVERQDMEEQDAERQDTERQDMEEQDMEQEEMEEPEPAGTECSLEQRSAGPRFPDLREQWEKSVTRGANEVSRNLTRKEGEALGAWRARQRAPIEAGHPEGRTRPMGDPRAEAHDGPYGPNELPFDPSCPPERPGKAEDGWLPEHMGAWFRAMVPKASEKEVRGFVRTIWDIPRASMRAGWPRDPNAPREKCALRGMSQEEIAGWLRKEVPDVTEYEAQNFAERWIERLEEAGEKKSEAAGVVVA